MPQDEQQPVKVVADYHQWINDCRVLALKEYWQKLKEVDYAGNSSIYTSNCDAGSRNDAANQHQRTNQEQERSPHQYHGLNGES